MVRCKNNCMFLDFIVLYACKIKLLKESSYFNFVLSEKFTVSNKRAIF